MAHLRGEVEEADRSGSSSRRLRWLDLRQPQGDAAGCTNPEDAFLYYPIKYEGQECSNNIFYTGATPNQQSEPATKFMYEKSPAAGKPFFLVGSDYVFPRTSNTITKEQLKSLGGEVVGEDYLPLGNTEVAPIISKIKRALPDGGVIINTLNGDQNVAFFKQIQAAGITPAKGFYVMSYPLTEEDLSAIGSIIGPDFLEGPLRSLETT